MGSFMTCYFIFHSTTLEECTAHHDVPGLFSLMLWCSLAMAVTMESHTTLSRTGIYMFYLLQNYCASKG